ncbi:hypothetical protein GEMRC1_005474 [Eukaryota sp. GEM-RC1]
MTIFPTISFDKIPCEWFCWCFNYLIRTFQQVSSFLDFFTSNFSTIVTVKSLQTTPSIVLIPEVFQSLSSNLPSEYTIFLLKSLIFSWKSSEVSSFWSVEDFVSCLSALNIDSNPIEFLNPITPLCIDQRLQSFLNNYISINSVRVMSNQNQEILNLKNELDLTRSYFTKQLMAERDHHAQQLTNVEQSFQTTFNAERNDLLCLFARHKSEIGSELTFHHFELRSDREKLQQSFQHQIGALSDKIEYNYQVYGRDIGHFDDSLCGSNLYLFNNASVVKSSSLKKITNLDSNNFVAIPLLEGCEVKLTLVSLSGSASLVYVDNKRPQTRFLTMNVPTSGVQARGRFSPSEPSFPPITQGHGFNIRYQYGQVIISPSTSRASFSAPVLKASVFGLKIHESGQTWNLERV